MNSPKHSKLILDDRSTPETEVKSVTENQLIPPKTSKKTASPEFSIDSLILRKRKDANTGNK